MRRLHRFVREPEALLARDGALPAGRGPMLELAGISVAVSGVAEPAAGVLQQLHGTGAAAGPPAVLLRAVPQPPGRFREAAAIDWDPYLALEARPDSVCAAGYRWLLRVRRSRPLHATLWFDGTARGAEAEDLWENVLRILMAYALLLGGGLLVHSAGIALDGGGVLFPGASGDGKSTVAALCEGQSAVVLSDDCNAVLPPGGGDGPRICGLPFGGELRPRRRVPGTFPLAALLTLRQAPLTGVRPLPAAELAARLMRAAPFVNADPEVADLLARRAGKLVGAVAGGELAFTLHGAVVEALRAFLAAREGSQPVDE